MKGVSADPPVSAADLINESGTSRHDEFTTSPCPSGIITQAAIKWKKEGTADFYGGSHTAPTPKEYTMQQLGLTLTRAYGMHLRKATQHMGTKPAKKNAVVAVDPPPGLDPLGATNNVVVSQRDACALA